MRAEALLRVRMSWDGTSYVHTEQLRRLLSTRVLVSSIECRIQMISVKSRGPVAFHAQLRNDSAGPAKKAVVLRLEVIELGEESGDAAGEVR